MKNFNAYLLLALGVYWLIRFFYALFSDANQTYNFFSIEISKTVYVMYRLLVGAVIMYYALKGLFKK